MPVKIDSDMDQELCDLLSRLGVGYSFVEDMGTESFYCSDNLEEQFQLPEQWDTADDIWRSVLHPDDYTAFQETRKVLETDKRIDQEFRFRTRDNVYAWMHFNGWLFPDKDRKAMRFCGILNNLSMWNSFDPITGLPGDREFRKALSEYAAKGTACGILLLSIDDLFQINELYSCSAGNRAMHFLAQRLRDRQPPVSQVYRLENDIFGITCTHANPRCLENCFHSFQQIASEPLIFGDHSITCSISGGGCFAPNASWDVETIYQCARLALSISRSDGPGKFTVYSDSLVSEMENDRFLVECLRASVREGFRDFQLFYQPLIFAQSGELYGCEALLRWKNSNFTEEIQPGTFIPILEKCGLMQQIDEWVLEQAVSQCAKWLVHKPDFQININVSSERFENKAFSNIVLAKLDEYQVPASAITLELTESRKIDDPQQVNQSFDALRKKGVKIAFDDFGMGYSSLGILRVLDADELKVDRSFLDRITEAESDRQLIRQIISFCHKTHMYVCIEGVETEAIAKIVKQMDVDLVQGFYYNPPISAEDFSTYYALSGSKTAFA